MSFVRDLSPYMLFGLRIRAQHHDTFDHFGLSKEQVRNRGDWRLVSKTLIIMIFDCFSRIFVLGGGLEFEAEPTPPPAIAAHSIVIIAHT